MSPQNTLSGCNDCSVPQSVETQQRREETHLILYHSLLCCFPCSRHLALSCHCFSMHPTMMDPVTVHDDGAAPRREVRVDLCLSKLVPCVCPERPMNSK